MAGKWSDAVRLDLDVRDVERVVRELGASGDQVGKAISRALRRTATTLRLRASKAAVSELQMRRAGDMRRRLKPMKARMHKSGGEIGIWVGLNDLAVSQLKGRMREYAGGATFRSMEYPGAFVARRGKKRSIYKRAGRGRFPIVEQTFPIKDQLDPILEDDVFPFAVEVFLKNFASDLRARTVFGVGK